MRIFIKKLFSLLILKIFHKINKFFKKFTIKLIKLKQIYKS